MSNKLPEAKPIWLLITKSKRQELIAWQKRHYPRRPLRPPESTVDVDTHDLEREMQRAPEAMEHMRK